MSGHAMLQAAVRSAVVVPKAEIGRIGRFRRYAGWAPKPRAGETEATDEAEAMAAVVREPFARIRTYTERWAARSGRPVLPAERLRRRISNSWLRTTTRHAPCERGR